MKYFTSDSEVDLLMHCSVFKKMDDAMKLHPDADVLLSFASLRSAYESTVEAMQYPQV